MVLTDKRILEEIERGDIVITPFNKKYLGCNSYDVHLADTMAMYKDDILDAKRHNKLITFRIYSRPWLSSSSRQALFRRDPGVHGNSYLCSVPRREIEHRKIRNRYPLDCWKRGYRLLQHVDIGNKRETARDNLPGDANRPAYLL